jgi:hypothetical protein
MLPENPYVTPFIATSGILGTLTLDHINTTVAILVGVLTMCYLAIKIYKEIFTKWVKKQTSFILFKTY